MYTFRKKRYRRYTIRGSGKKTSKKETKKQKEEKMLSAYGRNIRKPKRYVPTIHSPKKRKEKGAVATFGRFQPFTVGHMGLIAALEESFEISFETDDIVEYSSYKVGIEILKKYNVEIN